MRNLYVYSAVPPNSNRLLRKYGLLSGSEVVKFPEVLKAARPNAKDRRAFEKRVKEVLASERPYSMMGPSVLFTPPDPKKITDKHFIKKWNLQSIRIDLGRLLEDYPNTIVWGAELLPYDKAWRDMSEEEFEEEMAELGYASWEDFAAERSRELTLEEIRDFTQKRPEVIWEHYSKSDAGKMYASNVPHAFIITPMGYIPYEYIEYVDEAHMRKNPQPILELRTLTNNDDLTLICVCAETCPPELKDVDNIFFALFEMDENEHFLIEEDLTSREDIKTCIEIVEQFTNPISQLLQKLGLDDKTLIVLSAEEASEDSTFLGKRIESFKSFFENVEAHAIVVYCDRLYMRLSHSEYGMRRETLITIAHELGHAYTGDIYDEDGDLFEAEDNHGPDELEVEAFGREWADLVLGDASEAEIDAVISKFKADIERLKLAIESGEIDPYDRERPNPSREWFETQGRQNDGGVSRENLKRVIYEDGNQIITGVSWIRGPYDSAAHVELETNTESIVNYIFEHMKDIAKNLDEEGAEDSEIYEIERHIFSEKPMYLEYIHVDAKERGKGLGSVLMTELEDLLVQKGFDTVYLVAEPAERSAWYMRLGYSPIYPIDLEDFEEAGVVVMKKTISAS